MNAPATLTAKVTHGQWPGCGGQASTSPARARAPSTPPTNTAASSRRSIAGMKPGSSPLEEQAGAQATPQRDGRGRESRQTERPVGALALVVDEHPRAAVRARPPEHAADEPG